uniref:SCAN box domain-containing protein n=1 Tax=Pygocentrus nattereri TaxID=42514 RepID=A0AAR2M5E7_PYGNA
MASGAEETAYAQLGPPVTKFEISPETYRLRFRNDVVGEDESPRELYVRIKGLYEKWMLPNTKTKEQIGETIILEQFLKVVNPDLRSWILERGAIVRGRSSQNGGGLRHGKARGWTVPVRQSQQRRQAFQRDW